VQIFSPVLPFAGLMSVRMKQKAYAAASVDIGLGNKVKSTLPPVSRPQSQASFPRCVLRRLS
jgi:hypothetical protein